MKGFGKSHGAFSIVNGIGCGIGVSAGNMLTLESEFFDFGVKSDSLVVNNCVKKAFEFCNESVPEEWSVSIKSEIPQGVGMKSSSAVCNAIISSVFDYLKYDSDKSDIINLGVSCARASNITVTGALDDARACFFGGIQVTDNLTDSVIGYGPLADYDIIYVLPDSTYERESLNFDNFKNHHSELEELTKNALKEPFKTMIENSKLYSKSMNLDNSIAENAMESGAIGSSISGTGPAVAIITENGKSFSKEMGYENYIITKTRSLEL